jgi:hypothetical protein
VSFELQNCSISWTASAEQLSNLVVQLGEVAESARDFIAEEPMVMATEPTRDGGTSSLSPNLPAYDRPPYSS